MYGYKKIVLLFVVLLLAVSAVPAQAAPVGNPPDPDKPIGVCGTWSNAPSRSGNYIMQVAAYPAM